MNNQPSNRTDTEDRPAVLRYRYKRTTVPLPRASEQAIGAMREAEREQSEAPTPRIPVTDQRAPSRDTQKTPAQPQTPQKAKPNTQNAEDQTRVFEQNPQNHRERMYVRPEQRAADPREIRAEMNTRSAMPRPKRYRSRLRMPLICAAIAILMVGATILGIYASGMRYITRETAEGGEIKFFGKVGENEIPKEGTIYFPDGASAVITPDGKVTYSNGNVYEGQLVGLLRNGEGKMTYKNGDIYEGMFVNDALTGKGKFTFASGDTYEGDLVNGKKHGKGLYRWEDGTTYEGDFENDKKTGKGKMSWQDGTVYEGEYYNDRKSGTGTYRWTNGDVYEGTFIEDVRSGQGKYSWANGDTYEGQFTKNLMNGWGTYTWGGGRSYTGQFENGKIVHTTSDPNLN